MNIKSKIISYFLILMILAGLIVISCFSVFASDYSFDLNTIKFYRDSSLPSYNILIKVFKGTSSTPDLQGQLVKNGDYFRLTTSYNIDPTENYYLILWAWTTSGRVYPTFIYNNITINNNNITNNDIGILNSKNIYISSGDSVYINSSIQVNTSGSVTYQNGIYFKFSYISGYTLNFDSQGGSAITAESGVTDVTLGDSTGYFPKYIPTRLGYTFLGWSLTPGGTYIRDVELSADTIIYANWSTEYIPINWTEIGTEVGHMSFTSSWLLDDPDSNTHEIVNFDTCYYNLFDNELFFCNGTFDVDTYDGQILYFSTDSTEAYITYFPDYQNEGIVDIDLHSTLPVTTTIVMGLCDFEHLYSVTGWKLADFTQPDGTTTINYITQNIDLYTNVSLSSLAPVYSYNNRTITYYYSGTKSHWYNEFNITYYRAAGAPGFTETIKATNIENTNKYMFSINTQEFNEISISLKTYQVYQCALTISQYQGYVTNIYNGTEHLTGSSTFEYDSYKGIELRFDLEYPYVNVDVFLMELVEPPLTPEITYDYVINSTVLKADATDGEGMMRFYVTANPFADCELIINPRYITDYTIVERNPIVSINSEGEMSWIIDTENAWDDTMSAIDYAQITANIPHVFNGILDGVYGLTGLSTIVTLLLVIGFTSWIIRNY